MKIHWRKKIKTSIKRIWHPWTKWECYRAGFFNEQNPRKLTNKQAELVYKDFLSDLSLFESVLKKLIVEWPNSCKHNLTNEGLNKIAWLGQAAIAYTSNIPSSRRSGFNLLTEYQQLEANNLAQKYLDIWIENHLRSLDVES